MAAMGDSITAGTLADTSARAPAALNVLWEVIRSQFEQGPGSQYKNERKNLSWSTGQDIVSNFRLLSDYVATQFPAAGIEPLNVSVPGSRAWHMGAQAQQIIDAMATGRYQSLVYVTILVGANDACAVPQSGEDINEEVRSNLRWALTLLSTIRQDRKIRVLVSALPRIQDLVRPEITDFNLYPFISCGLIHNQAFGACNSILTGNYEQGEAAVQQKNQILREVVQQANELHPELDVYFSSAIENRPISVDDLALDCFHPTRRAQEELSARVWIDQPWFK
jgi:lysophospholipase L1-like esterase